MSTLWIVSELYYPEETSTGHFITHIAEALALCGDVKVICAQPTYSKRGLLAPKRDLRHGVQIVRCGSTRFDKNRWAFKILNMMTASVALFATVLKNIRPGDRVLVVTNPPSLPYLVAVAAWLRRVPYALKVDDVYPELLVAAGVLSPGSPIAKLWHAISDRLYRHATQIFVLGRDMAQLIRPKSNGVQITVVPNWADDEEITPIPKLRTRLVSENGLRDKFVVQCAGNLGPLQGLECVIEAASVLASRQSVHFTFIGSGRRERALRDRARELRLPNVSFLGRFGRDAQADFLNACDIAIVSLMPGMSGISVPSRSYNVMAAGKPVIAVMAQDCEVARMVREHAIGWVVPPGDWRGLAAAIVQAQDDPVRLAAMGLRARRLAESTFARRSVLGSYVRSFFARQHEPSPEPVMTEAKTELL